MDRKVSGLINPDLYFQDSRWLNYILDSADFTIISTDVNGVIRSFNQMALKKLGYKPEEVIGIHTPQLIHDETEVIARAKQLSAELGRTIKPGFEVFVAKAREGEVDENEWSYIRKDGTSFPVLLNVTAMKDDAGNIEGYLGIGRDISLRHELQSKIALQENELRQANRELLDANRRLKQIVQMDPLTQLLNRRGLHTCFELELARIRRNFQPLSLLLMDLDHFKQYNDNFGHLEGDRLLKELSGLMTSHTRSIDSIARFGGEEFVFLLTQTDEAVSLQIAERYRQVIETMQDPNSTVTASFGICTLDEVSDELSMLQVLDCMMKQADHALYAAKKAGRNRVIHCASLDQQQDPE